MITVFVGKTNTGKSTLLSLINNLIPKKQIILDLNALKYSLDYRITIKRYIVNNTLIMDEPTTLLTLNKAIEITKYIQHIQNKNPQLNIFYSTHQPQTLKYLTNPFIFSLTKQPLS